MQVMKFVGPLDTMCRMTRRKGFFEAKQGIALQLSEAKKGMQFSAKRKRESMMQSWVNRLVGMSNAFKENCISSSTFLTDFFHNFSS